MTEPQKPKKYYVRFSQPADEAKILEFYDLNGHKNVRKREATLLRDRIEEGAVVFIEDEAGKIVASSITYPHKVKDSDGVEHVKWQEIGSTRVVLNGYAGLFDAMVTMQVLRAFLVEPPEDRFVARMHTAPVQNMAMKLGWRAHTPTQELMDSQKKSVDVHDQSTAAPDINWYQAGVESLPVMASWMMKALDNPVLENKKTGEKIELDFTRSSFFNMFEAEIRNLSGKNFGAADTPDMTKGVQGQRDKWLKNFFR